MFIIRRTEKFATWLDGLKDRTTRIRLNRRLERASCGHLGDIKLIDGDVFEMREHFGPGWRMYCIKRGAVLIIMLGGGSKSTQTADIAKAIKYATTIEDRNND